MTAQTIRPAPLSESDRAEVVGIKGNSTSNPNRTTEQGAPQSKWRKRYKVHPAADVFPMMSDDELTKLGGDILVNGLREPIKMRGDELLDGRNRLEAAERVGFKIAGGDIQHLPAVDPVRFVISANINRRHLTKAQRADLIVAAIKATEAASAKPPQLDEVSKGGRGKVNKVKAEAVAAAEEQGISQATVERAFAKAEGRTPKPEQPIHVRALTSPDALIMMIEDCAKRLRKIPLPKPKDAKGLDAWRDGLSVEAFSHVQRSYARSKAREILWLATELVKVLSHGTNGKSTPDERLGKVAELLRGDIPGERSAAVEAANRLLKPLGMAVVVVSNSEAAS